MAPAANFRQSLRCEKRIAVFSIAYGGFLTSKATFESKRDSAASVECSNALSSFSNSPRVLAPCGWRRAKLEIGVNTHLNFNPSKQHFPFQKLSEEGRGRNFSQTEVDLTVSCHVSGMANPRWVNSDRHRQK
jgi:hypothetical protein